MRLPSSGVCEKHGLAAANSRSTRTPAASQIEDGGLGCKQGSDWDSGGGTSLAPTKHLDEDDERVLQSEANPLAGAVLLGLEYFCEA